MTEFFTFLKKGDFKAIFVSPTKNSFLQFFRYAFVGGIATVVDWGILFLLTEFAHIYFLISASIAFLAGLVTNFVLSRQLVFKASTAKVPPLVEFITYAIIGVVGLGITELILALFTNIWSIHYMLSKCIATVLVLFWNYAARKYILYK